MLVSRSTVVDGAGLAQQLHQKLSSRDSDLFGLGEDSADDTDDESVNKVDHLRTLGTFCSMIPAHLIQKLKPCRLLVP